MEKVRGIETQGKMIRTAIAWFHNSKILPRSFLLSTLQIEYTLIAKPEAALNNNH